LTIVKARSADSKYGFDTDHSLVGITMPYCRFYLMSRADHIVGVRVGAYDAREDAERRAAEILNAAQCWIDAVEGWDQARLICRVMRNQAQSEQRPPQRSLVDVNSSDQWAERRKAH
jgi:hypothetical protein